MARIERRRDDAQVALLRTLAAIDADPIRKD
jgi:hypothetical protein